MRESIERGLCTDMKEQITEETLLLGVLKKLPPDDIHTVYVFAKTLLQIHLESEVAV